VNKNAYVYWTDDAVTINGYSLVLKITFGTHTFLFGGDLNTKSETYLMQKHAPLNPFEVDVAKSCHYGSSDFTEVFMQLVNPFATVIFSGDNESFSHPRADAVGCAGRYTKGKKRPLVYSTELAAL
jgi:competence protein ComEC